MDRRPASFFYDQLPRLRSFAELSDPGCYTPVPGDWVVGCADIVGSTQAIAAGKYKTVNMVGAAVISAQINVSDGRAFPFVFGGDGAAFACPPEQAETAARALAAVQCWAAEEFGLSLRTALVSIDTIRQAGVDVAVARYQASEDVDYAMFGGGGISWAEARMKQGAFAVTPAAPGTQPDLTGLSCRWSQIKARNGTILSVVIQPSPGASAAAFTQVADQVIGIAQKLARSGHPVPLSGPDVGWPAGGIDAEARASRGALSVGRRRRQLWLETLFAWLILRSGIKVGGFRPRHYRQMVGRNADYRKFDDGLKMTLDCDQSTLDALRTTLEQARAAGVIDFGMFQQDEAMMTCIVTSVMQDDHVHFIDGASGGYAQAAAQIKIAQTAAG